MSQVLSHYPHLAPGLCGKLACPRICQRVCHCEAGLRLAAALQAERAQRRLAAVPNRRQLWACGQVRELGLCPSLCQSVGGCLLPRHSDHPSECRRKAFRAQRVIDALVARRQSAPKAGAA